jgi:hypothetical protein
MGGEYLSFCKNLFENYVKSSIEKRFFQNDIYPHANTVKLLFRKGL